MIYSCSVAFTYTIKKTIKCDFFERNHGDCEAYKDYKAFINLSIRIL